MASLIGRFRSVLLAAADEELRADPTLGGKLVLERDDRIVVSYAPFDHIQQSARVVIVGITPGAQQASNALLAARKELRERSDEACALASAKVFASFSGPMRSNLVEMLDYVAVNRWLGVETTATLWNTNQHLVHFTSALRYPVFIDGKNYSGQPSMIATSILRKLLDLYLREEAIALQDALWIPLGPFKASEATTWLIQKGVIPATRVRPHPSGANGERIAYFVGRKRREALSAKTDPKGIDVARARIIAFVDQLSAAGA